MGLLDGGIARTFGAVFSSIYLDGTLHRITKTSNGRGGWNATFADTPIKGQRDACTESMRREEGYTERDVRLIVLTRGVTGDITTDDEITLAGARWSVQSVDKDTASSHWVLRGRPSG